MKAKVCSLQDFEGSFPLFLCQMSETVDIVVAAAAAGPSALSAVRGVNAHRGMSGLNASAGAVGEMNLQHHRIVPKVTLFLLFAFSWMYHLKWACLT